MSQRLLSRLFREGPATGSLLRTSPSFGKSPAGAVCLSRGVLGSQSGAALVSAVALSILLGIMVMGYMQVAVNAYNQGQHSLHNDDAFNAAESGLMLGTTWLRSNYAELDMLAEGAVLSDVIPELQIGGTTVEIQIVRTDTGARIEAWARDRGRLGYDKLVSQEVVSLPDGPPFDLTAFDYSIVCGGSFEFRGCGGITSNLKLHANGALSIGGNAGTNLDISSSTSISVSNNRTVNGSATAPLLDIPAKATVTGTKTVTAVSPVTIPDIDLQPWYDVALANGQVFSSFSNANYTPPGGVVWVNGDVTLDGGPGTTFNGTLIATGKVSIAGQVNMNAPTGGFAIASQTGDIDITSSGLIRGLIYAKSGDYSQTANGEVQGQLVISGDIKKGGNSDVMVYRQCIPAIPGQEGESDNGFAIVEGSWREDNAAH